MKTNKTFRMGLLALAITSAVGSSTVLADNNSGGISGSVIGAQGGAVVVKNAATGREVTISTDSSGNFRLSNLAIGEYIVSVGDELRTVVVQIGSDTKVTLGQSISEVLVMGGKLDPIVDTQSSGTSLNISALELSRIPLPQSVTAVALLAPSTTAGDSRFGNLASFGGSSVAENTMYINGLNVTNFRNGLGFSSVPFEFYEAFEVKTGGYSAEYGRSTGGVINAVTKSGTNEFEFVLDINASFDSLRETSPNTKLPSGEMYGYNSADSYGNTNVSLSASGPIIQDKLFFYAMYNPRDIESKSTNGGGDTYFNAKADDAFWGAKVDWYINDNHRLEYTMFSDANDSVTTSAAYDLKTTTVGDPTGVISTTSSGGENYSLKYSGQITDTFAISALVGENKYNLTSGSNLSDKCNLIVDIRAVKEINSYYPSCVNTSGYFIEDGDDTREAMRIDAEWLVGDHLVRFGVDSETNTSYSKQKYSGPGGVYWYLYDTNPGAQIANGSYIPDGVYNYARSRMRTVGGSFETEAAAMYIEDIWNVTDDVTLSLGLRSESFKNKNGEGATFVEIKNMIAPRLGLSWDVNGDGDSKLFASAGRYFLPVANNTNVRLSGNEYDYRTFYVLASTSLGEQEGQPVVDFVLGPQIGPVQILADGEVPEVTTIVDQDIDPMFQDEYVVGYQAMINDDWSWGVKVTKRDMNGAIDDMLIDGWHEGKYGCGAFNYVLGNPGKEMTIGANPSCDHETIVIETVSGADIGYDEASRSYKSVELTLARAWQNDWSLDGSYTWGSSKGNSEGLVKSDNGQTDAGLTTDFDLIDIMDGAYGYLPNDRRHMIKARGTYAFNDNLRAGFNVTIESGRPLNAFGIGHPNGVPAYGDTYYTCVADCETGDNADAEYSYNPRGTFGRTPWTVRLDASVVYDMAIAGTDVQLRAEVFNLLDASGALRYNEYAEQSSPGTANPQYGAITAYQTPRYISLGANIRF